MSSLKSLLQWFIATYRDFVYLSTVVVYNLFGLIDVSKPIIENPNGSSSPMILIHGSAGNNSEWMFSLQHISKHFRNHPVYGFTLHCEKKLNTFSHKLSTPDLYIEEYADLLEELLKKERSLGWYDEGASTKKKFILVGHSMGGLIALELAKRMPERIEKIVGISTPYQGAPLLNSCLSSILRTKRHRQMTPNSEYLRSIDREKLKHKVLTVGSDQDVHVPNSASKFTNDCPHLPLTGYSHFNIVSCEDLWKFIARSIQSFHSVDSLRE